MVGNGLRKSRKTIMKKITLIFSVIFLVGCSGQSENIDSQSIDKNETFNWRLVTSWPKNYPGLGMAPERIADLVEEMSDGQMKITVYGAEEQVPAFGVFDAVSSGSHQMGHSGGYFWKGKVPAAQFFTSVPFGLTADEINAWVNRGGGLELWREIYAPFNIYPIPAGNTGTQMFGWFNKEINSLEDVKGLKMRIPGIGGEVLKEAGGIPVTLPGGELFTALQTGVIDATEWVGPYNDLTFGFHQAAKYYYYPGWHEPGPMLELLINIDAWNSLPNHLKVIIETATKAVNQDMLDEYLAKNNQALTELVEVHGVELRKLPDDVIEEFREISNKILDDLAKEDESIAKVYESYLNFKNNVSAYHEISEDAFVESRNK
ncbi:MAG: TRAP transporter substrate-binding protein [SAR86 cluster bacterium]|uniref:TRAP transporter substrate-binding protein n=1 Tax=SAR86 cluster bacterium TaxID=2030880 RepID=A0A520N432_9GAMM|nr:MAG: TRAP transporter substrate-binding protein [SAR86 cluster bacterium]